MNCLGLLYTQYSQDRKVSYHWQRHIVHPQSMIRHGSRVSRWQRH